MKPGLRWWLIFIANIIVLIAIFAVPLTVWRVYGLSSQLGETIGWVAWYGAWLLAALVTILVYESFRVGGRTAFNVCALVVACALFYTLERQANIDSCNSIHGGSDGSFRDTLGFMLEEMLPREMLKGLRVVAVCEFVL